MSNFGCRQALKCCPCPLDDTPWAKYSFSYLAVDNDWSVDVCSQEGVAECVEVWLEGGGAVADGDAVVGEAGEGGLEVLDDLGEGGQLLDLNLRLLLVDVDHLDLAAILGTGLQNPQELLLVSLDGGAYKYTKADPLQNALFERNTKFIRNSPIGNE